MLKEMVKFDGTLRKQSVGGGGWRINLLSAGFFVEYFIFIYFCPEFLFTLSFALRDTQEADVKSVTPEKVPA